MKEGRGEGGSVHGYGMAWPEQSHLGASSLFQLMESKGVGKRRAEKGPPAKKGAGEGSGRYICIQKVTISVHALLLAVIFALHGPTSLLYPDVDNGQLAGKKEKFSCEGERKGGAARSAAIQ